MPVCLLTTFAGAQFKHAGESRRDTLGFRFRLIDTPLSSCSADGSARSRPVCPAPELPLAAGR
jgi:hypothetical protein